jgi:hypothetical protein
MMTGPINERCTGPGIITVGSGAGCSYDVRVLVMGKGKCAITKTAVKRACEGAKEAGVQVQIVLDLNANTITLTPVKVSEADTGVGNDLDQWMKKHARATEGH